MGSKRNTFEILNHTADLGIVVTGENLKALFQNAAHALLHIMLEDPPQDTGETGDISIDGADLPDLMIRWLGEILYLFEGENRCVTRTKIYNITPDHLDAQIETVPFPSAGYELLTEIKAVTYHQSEVIQVAGLWRAKIIFDL